jgi:hypothetical protein
VHAVVGVCGFYSSKVHAMTSDQERAVRLLNRADSEYFDFDESRQLQLQGELAAIAGSAAGAAPPPTLALGAPGRVNLDVQTTVPVLIGSVQSGLRAWQVNFRTNLQLFLRNLDTGTLRVAQPLVDMRRGAPAPLSGKGNPPDALNASAVDSSVTRVNLREKFGEAVVPGRFAVSAVANELRSNSVSMILESRRAPPRSPPAPATPYVRHRLEPRPHVPTTIDVPAQVARSGAAHVRVAIQVGEDAGVRRSESGPATWQSHVLMVQLDAAPRVIPVVVPVQQVTTGDGRTAYNAVFLVDLHSATATLPVGSYQVYIDIGRELLGPYPLAVSD